MLPSRSVYGSLLFLIILMSLAFFWVGKHDEVTFILVVCLANSVKTY